jgi:hypothetical protein
MRPVVLFIAALALSSCGVIATPTPSGSPSPTEFVVPTRSPVPTPPPFTGHYGFLEPGAGGWSVRRESDTTSLGVIPLDNIAVSPDGRIVAGWAHGSAAQLVIVDVARPSVTQTVVTLGPGERGQYVAWSVDGSGLVYSVSVAGAETALRTLDVTQNAQKPNEVARIEGVTLRPALWDRVGGDLVAALVIDGGLVREYMVVRGTQPPDRRRLPDNVWQDTPAVSGDGRWVVIAAKNEPTVRVFRSDDPGFVVETHGDVAGSGASGAGRPMYGQIAIVLDRELTFWDPETNQRGKVPAATDVFNIIGFRFDGSAAIITTASGPTLVDPSGKLTPLTGEPRYGIALP